MVINRYISLPWLPGCPAAHSYAESPQAYAGTPSTKVSSSSTVALLVAFENGVNSPSRKPSITSKNHHAEEFFPVPSDDDEEDDDDDSAASTSESFVAVA